MHKLVIFDLDGTLVESWTGDILPGRMEMIKHLRRQGVKIAVATNQGGVGLRYWMETEGWGEPTKYQNDLETILRLQDIQRLIGTDIPMYTCFYYQTKTRKPGPIPLGNEHHRRWDPEYRKPRPGMLLEAMVHFSIRPDDTLMVGNGVEDARAAFNAGCDFMDIDQFMREYQELGDL
jgi:HAD superfamily hydrolase (TIGR01662 family)